MKKRRQVGLRKMEALVDGKTMMTIYNSEMLIQENRKDKCLELEIEIKNTCRRKRKRTVRKMEGETEQQNWNKCVDIYAVMNWKLIKIEWYDIKGEITNECMFLNGK
jgi:hypothetical protein